jgi:peroxiredoxin
MQALSPTLSQRKRENKSSDKLKSLSGIQKEGVGSMSTNQNEVSKSQKPKSALPPGSQAPDFTLAATPDQKISLSDFRGRPVILAFYPADWSPVCGDQMSLYNEVLPEFKRFNAELLGISVDGAWCHSAYRQNRNLHFTLLSDFEPKGEVARDYGVYRKSEGVCERALFVIDGNGRIAWSYVSPIGVNPGADGILKALENLSAKEEPADGNQPGRHADTAGR